MESDPIVEKVNLGSKVKFVEEKHAATEIQAMYWSPQTDLAAAVCSSGSELTLYRLNGLKKVWTYPSPSEDSLIVGVSWEPSGKCLAVAYTTQQVIILAIEKATLLHTHHTISVPKALNWVMVGAGITCPNKLFADQSSNILPSLPSINRENEMHHCIKEIFSDNLTCLLVSGDNGLVNFYVYGLLSVAYIDLISFVSHECTVLSSCLSQSGSHLVSVVKDYQNQLSLITVTTNALRKWSQEIRVVADKFVHLINLIEYSDQTIKKMEEAWEDGLMELDSKLNSFSTQKRLIGQDTVVNDFAELLLFGTPSIELQTFLVKDLTDRGMKKLGISMQNYYRTIHELLSSHMINAVESIFYHLNDLLGLSNWTDVFGSIGLSTSLILEAVQTCGSLRLKINEMLHLVTNGTKNLKAFSCWLYITILVLTEQKIPAELTHPPIDHDAVMSFIEDNFEGFEDGTNHIKLEKIGQYLKDCDLHYLPKQTRSKVATSLEQSQCLKDSCLLYKTEEKKSLVQLWKNLVNKISDALSHPASCIAKAIEMVSERKLQTLEKISKIRQFSVSHEDDVQYLYTTALGSTGEDNCLNFQVTRMSLSKEKMPVHSCQLVFQQIGRETDQYGCNRHQIIDFDYYDKEELMFLLKQDSGSSSPQYLTARLDLSHIAESCWNESAVFDAGPSVDVSTVKLLDNVSKAMQISVGGKRQIGSVMLTNRRVQLFMYDTEETDSDDDKDDSVDLSTDDGMAAGGSDKENIN